MAPGQRHQPAHQRLVEGGGGFGGAQGLLGDGPHRREVVLHPVVHLPDQEIAPLQRLLQRRDQPDVFERGGGRPGDHPKLGDLGRRRSAHLAPVGADRGDRVRRPDRRHHQALHEGRTVGVVRDALVLVDVRDHRGLAVEHDPAGNAVLQRETLAFPQRPDRVLFHIVALIRLAEHDGDPVRPRQPPGGGPHRRRHVWRGARQRQLLDGVDHGGQQRIGGAVLGGHGEIFCGATQPGSPGLRTGTASRMLWKCYDSNVHQVTSNSVNERAAIRRRSASATRATPPRVAAAPAISRGVRTSPNSSTPRLVETSGVVSR